MSSTASLTTPNTEHILLVLGAGPKIGASTATAFAERGYKIALAARSHPATPTIDDRGYLLIKIDLSNPTDVPAAFDAVKESFGMPPSVVVYNGANRSLQSARDPLSDVDPIVFASDFNINATSALVAAKHALLGFRTLPTMAAKCFIYTGNKLNVMPQSHTLTFGMGKTSVAHFICIAAKTYKHEGIKFYYTDERKMDGTHAGEDFDAPARAELYVQLAALDHQAAWQQTFVKGKGYVDFSRVDEHFLRWDLG